jgi:hypothetical protein
VPFDTATIRTLYKPDYLSSEGTFIVPTLRPAARFSMDSGLERVLRGDFLVAGDGSSELEEGAEEVAAAFVADG